MENSLLQFILSKEDERKNIIYLFLAFVLSIIISCKIYGHFISSFTIIPLTDYKGIVKDFLFSGRFIVSFFILIAIYKLFYSILDFWIYLWFARLSDKIYEFLKREKEKIKNEFLEEVKTNKKIQSLFKIGFNIFKQLNIIEYENNKVTLGVNFYSILEAFRQLNDDKEDDIIDLQLAYFPIPIALQLFLLFDTVVIHHYNFSCIITVLLNIAIIIILAVQLLVYFINVFIELKKHKILSYLEGLEKRVNATTEPNAINTK